MKKILLFILCLTYIPIIYGKAIFIDSIRPSTNVQCDSISAFVLYAGSDGKLILSTVIYDQSK